MNDDRVQRERIRQIHDHVQQRCGSPQAHQELRAQGIRCGNKRVERLNREDGLGAKSARSFRVATQSKHLEPIENHLARQLSPKRVEGPNGALVGDITYIPTKEGWLYPPFILDLASRRGAGWALCTRLDQEFSLGHCE